MSKYTIYKASAGTGKTYQLSHYLRQKLRSGELRPNQLIATTFTKKAAAELAGRLREDLMAEGERELARLISTSLIGTVNSVTAQLVGQFPIEVGISPDAQVLDEQEQEILFNQISSEHQSEFYGQEFDVLDRMGLLEIGYGKHITPFAQHVKSIANFARMNAVSAEDIESHKQYSLEHFDFLIEQAKSAGLDVLSLDGFGEIADRVAKDALQRVTQLENKENPGDTENIFSECNGHQKRTLYSMVEKLEQKKRDLLGSGSVKWKDVTERWKLGVTGKVIAALDSFLEPSEANKSLLLNPDYQNDVRRTIDLAFTTVERVLRSYKQHKVVNNLLDFNDQELMALELLDLPQVQEELRRTYNFLAVDEFQDTSPLQLAIYMKLGSLVDEVFWVGDPKQAIYGFRGSDVSLMDQALAYVNQNFDCSGHVLNASWRSSQVPLKLSNQLFSQSLAYAPLSLGDKESQAGGKITYTKLKGALGSEITVEFLEKLFPDFWAGRSDNAAILVPSNSDAQSVVETLLSLGVQTSGQGRSLLSTREGQMIFAGLKLVNDFSDTQALLELVVLLENHAAHNSWLSTLVDAEDRRSGFDSLRQDPELARLLEVQSIADQLTLDEVVVETIAALNMRQRLNEWSVPAAREATLGFFVGQARAFANTQLGKHCLATLPGFLRYIEDTDPFVSIPPRDGTVFVDTMHQSKGLEWDEVAVLLKAPRRDSELGKVGQPFVVPAEKLDIEDPLANRKIDYVPHLTSDLTGNQVLLDEARIKSASDAERAEKERLGYVALTRAKKHTAVLSNAKVETDLVKDLSEKMENPDLPWQAIKDIPTDGVEIFQLPLRHYEVAAHAEGDSLLDVVNATSLRRMASDAESVGIEAKISPVPTTMEGFDVIGGQNWDAVGQAIHSYLATPYTALSKEDCHDLALRVLNGWEVNQISAEQLIAVGQNWHSWCEGNLSVAERMTEVPFTWVSDDGEMMRGYIDEIVETTDGKVIVIDHKSYPGADPEAHIRKKYLGQMSEYRTVVYDITGKYPDQLLIHMPLIGKVFDLQFV